MQDAAGHHLSSKTHIAATDGNSQSPIIPGTFQGISPAGYGDMNREHRGRRPDQISVAARRRNPSDRNPHPDRMVRSQNQNGKTSVPRARDTHGQHRRFRSSGSRQVSLCSTSPSTYGVAHSPQPPVMQPGSTGTPTSSNTDSAVRSHGTVRRTSDQTSQISNAVTSANSNSHRRASQINARRRGRPDLPQQSPGPAPRHHRAPLARRGQARAARNSARSSSTVSAVA